MKINANLYKKYKYLKSIFTWKNYNIIAKLLDSYNNNIKVPEILFIGDSSVNRISFNDVDKRRTDQILNDIVNKFSVIGISHAAYTMRHYYHIVKLFEVLKNKPKLVIIPINMRSFSPSWHKRPSFKFDSEINLLREYRKKQKNRPFYLVKKEIPTKEELKKFLEIKVNFPLTKYKSIFEFEECIKKKEALTIEQVFKRKKEILIYHYLYNITQDNPILFSMDKLQKLFEELNIKYLFYITPINYQCADRYVGESFIKEFSYNIKKICETLTENDCKCINLQNIEIDMNSTGHFIDLSNLLSESNFFHKDELTEHINIDGKKEIANVLSAVIEKFFLGII